MEENKIYINEYHKKSQEAGLAERLRWKTSIKFSREMMEKQITEHMQKSFNNGLTPEWGNKTGACIMPAPKGLKFVKQQKSDEINKEEPEEI